MEGISSFVHLTEFAYLALLVWLATDGAGPLSLDWLITYESESLATSRLPGDPATRATP